MKEPDRRILKSKKSIREACLRLIKTNDFHSITVTEMAKEADVDRKTFYLHYSSTYDVLKEIETEIEEKVLELLRTKDFNIDDFFKGLNAIMMDNVDLYNRISKSTNYSFLKNNCKNILKSTLITSFQKRSGLATNEFNICAEYISSGIIGIYTDWLSNPKDVSLNELTLFAKSTVVKGWEKIIR